MFLFMKLKNMLQILYKRNNYFRDLCNISSSVTTITIRRINTNNILQKLIRLETSAFQPRILKYFTNDNDILRNDQLTNYSPLAYEPNTLRKVDHRELSSLIHFLLVRNFPINFKYYLHYLDKECCLRLPELTFSEIFEILCIFFYYLPHKIIKLEFYKKSIHMLSFSIEQCSKLELIKLCFYVGLQKKSKQAQYILTECLTSINKKYLNELNINDMCVLCNACYKTSTKIKFKTILNKVIEIINNNLSMLNDPPIFIELVKSLRHNQYQDEEILNTISYAIFFNKSINKYNFTACSHILALYADIRFYEESLIKLLTIKCVTHMKTAKLPASKKEHFSNQIRIKDLANFLWSLSYLSYEDLEENVISEYVEPFLSKYISLENLHKDIEYVIDILLSLYVLGYKPQDEILKSVVTNSTASVIYGKRIQAYITRFNLLLTCIKLENEELFTKLNVKYTSSFDFNINSQLKNRPLLKKLYDSLNDTAVNFDLKRFVYSMSIPYLHIMGITGYNKQNEPTLQLELVDERLLLQNISDKANGFINLKIRLLRKIYKNILVIYQSEIEDKNKTELNRYLEKRLKRIYIP